MILCIFSCTFSHRGVGRKNSLPQILSLYTFSRSENNFNSSFLVSFRSEKVREKFQRLFSCIFLQRESARKILTSQIENFNTSKLKNLFALFCCENSQKEKRKKSSTSLFLHFLAARSCKKNSKTSFLAASCSVKVWENQRIYNEKHYRENYFFRHWIFRNRYIWSLSFQFGHFSPSLWK